MKSSDTAYTSENRGSLSDSVKLIFKRFEFASVQVAIEWTVHVTLIGSVDGINDRPIVVVIAQATLGVPDDCSDITVGKPSS